MDSSKIKTLQQVSDAIDAVEDLRAVKGLSGKEKDVLEKSAVALRNIERSIIKTLQDQLVSVLTTDCDALKNLTADIEKVSKKLDKLTDILEKTTKAVEGLIAVITTAVGAGLL